MVLSGTKPLGVFVFFGLMLIGCNGSGQSQSGDQSTLLSGSSSGTGQAAPTDSPSQNIPDSVGPGTVLPAPSGGTAGTASGNSSTSSGAVAQAIPNTIGGSCHTDDPNKACLAIRYVSYVDGSNMSILGENDIIQNLDGINSLWNQCNIQFQVEEFYSVNPAYYGLNYNTASLSELTNIRAAFQTNTALLVVTTGKWTGSLGALSANAWTTMPGAAPYGSIFESSVATYTNIIAHELGHYLNLSHVSDASNVMNPVIYPSSSYFYSSQCYSAMATAKTSLAQMLR